MPRSEESKAVCKAGNVRYKAANIKRVPLDMQRKDYEALQVHVMARGGTINGYIKRAIQEAIQRDNQSAGD